jgi:putative FmdB family regulatory protein
MPVYVYRNLKTGETFEVEQRITESAWTEHPESGDPVKRLVQPVGIAFKGSGFYVTDSRGAPKPGANGAKGDGQAASASSDRESGSKGATTDGASKGDGTSGAKKDAKGGGASTASGSAGQS